MEYRYLQKKKHRSKQLEYFGKSSLLREQDQYIGNIVQFVTWQLIVELECRGVDELEHILRPQTERGVYQGGREEGGVKWLTDSRGKHGKKGEM